LIGLPGAPGLALGRVKRLSVNEEVAINRSIDNNPAEEQIRMDHAVRASRAEIGHIKLKVADHANANDAHIFDAHLSFLDDPALIKRVSNLIGQGWNAEAAWCDSIDFFVNQLKKIKDPVIQARSADVADVGQRVLNHLTGRSMNLSIDSTSPVIIIAEDLSPSITASLDKDTVLAFCTAQGSNTSHVSILAKALGIPAVVGLGEQLSVIKEEGILLVDGSAGSVIVEPDQIEIDAFIKHMDEVSKTSLSDHMHAFSPAVSLDGRKVEVVANIGSVADAKRAVEAGADGVGLLRTEFLYLNESSLPDETYQVKVYSDIAAALGSLPVVVRTLDIGGDKAVPYLGTKNEANPFMGWRAIRMINERPDILLSQFRSLLRGFAGSQLYIMLPMVSSINELEDALAIFNSAKTELQNEKCKIAENVKLGIMIEVPATAILADHFARMVDFFSIGTNDLTQYTLAVDRTNQRVAHISSPFHPAVIHLIKMTIDAAHQHGKWVGLCGEMAGDPLAIPLLLGMGLDEFSMVPALIPRAKRIIRNCNLRECQQIAKEALASSKTKDVKDYLVARFGSQL
jgi:phosphoenolpyruvate-protein phosphotransferase